MRTANRNGRVILILHGKQAIKQKEIKTNNRKFVVKQ